MMDQMIKQHLWNDQRTDEQRETHVIGIAGTDTFLSGWGPGEDRQSIAIWACKPEDRTTVMRWVKKRGDMKHVRVLELDSQFNAKSVRAQMRREQNGAGLAPLITIYGVHDSHPALES